MANPDWVRDEVILALDVFLSDRSTAGNKSHPKVIELSQLLNQLPLFPIEMRDATFRNVNGVSMKLSNFLRLDPTYSGVGLTAGGNLEKEVWEEFYNDRDRLNRTAESIKQLYSDPNTLKAVQQENDDIIEAPEGKILTAIHRFKERSRKLVDRKKQQVLREKGILACEVCGFNFKMTYGNMGDGFIECHHDLPVSSLAEDGKTSINNLRLVCSNCHSMIHRTKPWLTIEALRNIIFR